MEENEFILSKMPVSKAIAKIGVPAIMAMLIMAIYNLVDTIFIGRLDSAYAMSAVSIAFPIMALMTAIGQIFGAGACASIGRAFGKGDDNRASKIATTAIYSAIFAGILFMVFGLLFSDQIFKLFGTADAVMPDAKAYGTWMFVGAVFSIPNQSFNNIARAETRAKLSMMALMLGAILNIILDPFFMFELNGFGLNLGIKGASMATTLAQAISFAFISYFFFADKMKVKIKFKNFLPKRDIYFDILRSGIPIGVTQILSTVAVSFTNIIAIYVATDEISGINMQSAYGVVLKVLTIVQFVVIGYLQGYQPLASYSYGAKDKKRFFTCFRYALNFVVIYSIVASGITVFFADKIVALIAPMSQDVIEAGATLLRYNTMFLVFLGFIYFVMLTFQATGDGKYGAIIAFARQGFVYIPALIVFTLICGLDGIFYAQPFSDAVTLVISVLIYNKYKNNLIRHFNQ